MFGNKKENKKTNIQQSQSTASTKKNIKKRTTQETIPFLNAYQNGIIESQKNYYTKAYKLLDFNFRSASDDNQKKAFNRFQDLLNVFSKENRIQIVINNRNIDEDEIRKNVMCELRSDQLDDYRKDLNKIVLNAMAEGRNNLVSDKYIVVGTKARNAKDAATTFSSRIDREINNRVKQIVDRQNVNIPPMSIRERLKCLHDIYNVGNELQLPENYKLEEYLQQGMSVKDIVAPSWFKFHSDFFEMGDKVGRVLYLKNMASTISTDMFAEIAELPFNMTASVFLEPIDQNKAVQITRDKLTDINMNIKDIKKKQQRDGDYSGIISPSLEHSQEQAQYFMEDLRGNNQRAFFMTVVIACYADDKKALDENTKQVIDLGNRYLCGISKLIGQQEPAFNSALPLAINELGIKRFVKTETAALFIPFNAQEIRQKNGIYYGLNALSKNLIVLNRSSKENKNPNGLILGMPGSGKSLTAKMEIVSILLTKDSNNEIYVLDPEAEYVPMAMVLEDVGASVVHLEPGSGLYVNPFDLDMHYGDDEDNDNADPIAMKIDNILALCETAMSSRFGLSNIEKGIIDRCVRRLYAPYIQYMNSVSNDISIDTEASPTMADFYEELRNQPEPEAQNIALSIEIFSTGTFDSFAHKTNVVTSNRLVVYDIKKIGTGMKELGLQVCLNHIWNRTIDNFKKGIRTYIYIDEFHLLTKSESSSIFVQQIFKRARKWNGVPCAITQNVSDLFKSDASIAIISNCEFIIMLSQSPVDRINLQNLLHISDAQLEYITDSPSGQGLIYNGQAIIPFNLVIPEESKVFKLISTRPEDVFKNRKELISA